MQVLSGPGARVYVGRLLVLSQDRLLTQWAMAADHGAASVNYVALTLLTALVSDLPPAAVLRRVFRSLYANGLVGTGTETGRQTRECAEERQRCELCPGSFRPGLAWT
jgi:ABC-type uncharacterized transport system permease subunit